jgi:glycosyltransferase involved in cell wall biosynthesis
VITAIILAFNEEKHIKRCIRSLSDAVNRIVVVDSGSIDRTVEIANELGADTYQKEWVNHAEQFNWALDNVAIQTPWVLRLDADEVLTAGLAEVIGKKCGQAGSDVSGFTLNRQIHFQRRWIRHGGIYPLRMLRLFRYGKGRCEQRWMDEHIVVDGRVEHIDADIIDDNLNSLSWWVDKHNGYATREVIDNVLAGEEQEREPDLHMSAQAKVKRWMKESVYNRLPLGVRPGLYFFYRYFIRLGFLDGRQGLVFHVLQGFWYRFLVDAKLLEVRAFSRKEGVSERAAIERLYGVKI